ncbi:DUF2514 family protein [Aeromonas veronii]|uniref:DUF2514 family protein n=1 Tax=Aeromonas veronii TaxID=654 RepID=UPI0013170573|nr:DUF2514 family protein [Aeromonas veronii]MBL0492805.1 DUF2514 domain-containing protein [Aeromonas veronii]QHB82649.1 DUF2514 family protein [Aeromonas veronii]
MVLFPQSGAVSFLAGMLVIAVLAGSGIALYRSGYSAGEEGERKTWQAKWDRQAAALAEARAQNLELAREEELRRQRAIEKVRQDAEQQIARVQTDAVAANVVAVSLREQIRRLAARASQCASHSNSAQPSQAVEQPAVVLADVLGRIDARAGELAAAYDLARAAGLACEQAYDALRADSLSPGP